MRRLARTIAALAILTAMPGLVAVALAHGAAPRAPPHEEPPDNPEPTDPPPPPEDSPPPPPGAAGTPPPPGAGEPSAPPGAGGAPGGGSTPSAPSSGGGGSPGGAPQGGGGAGGGANGRAPGASKSVGFGGWAFWWSHNRDEILQLKRAVRGIAPRTGDSFGTRNPNAVVSATDAAIQERIVPALRRLLADESQSFHICSAAELALAKIGDTSIVDTLRRMALNETKSFHREVEETAALALGVMQQDSLATKLFLADIARDGARDGTFVRPFAAISLGLLGDRNDPQHDVVAALLDVVARREPGADIKPACLAALGLLDSDVAVPELLALLRGANASTKGTVPPTDIELAYVVAALGRIGRPGLATEGDETAVLDEIVRVVDKDKLKASANVRRSAVIALGQIALRCNAKIQRRVIDVLKRAAEESAEEQERCFAVMSLGRIGAVRNPEPGIRTDLIGTLGRVMDKGPGQLPAFAAMALGLIGRAIEDEGGAAPEEGIRAPLRAKFAAGGPSQLRGAFALASGLVRDPLAVDHLLRALKDRSEDKRVRGWCALALGMIGARESADAIRATLRDDGDRDLRVQAAMAAGLLNDARVVDDVVAVIRDRDASNYELGSAAIALGRIGDERSVDALVDIAIDKAGTYPDLTRALAVVALGQIGDRRDVPALSRLSTDVNYRAHVPAITELLSIL